MTELVTTDNAVPTVHTAWHDWYIVVVLSLICLLGFMDRYTISLISPAIMRDLGITQVQMSLLVGLSFITLYSVLSIPAGYLADKLDRRYLLFGAVLLWSSMSLVCGIANSYGQLFLGRLGLGIGEAVLPPTAYSLIRDGVSPARRGRAFGIYQLGGVFGTGLGNLLGGTLFSLGAAGAFVGVPLLAHLRPWQLVLAIPGLMGIPASLLLLTLREPQRALSAAATTPGSFGDLFRYAAQNRSVYLPLFIGTVLSSIALSGWVAWLPTMMNHKWGLPIGSIGKMTGSITLIAAPINAIILSSIMDHVARGRSPARAIVAALIGGTLSLCFALSIVLAPSEHSMWVAYTLSVLITSGSITAPALVIAYATPSRLTGKMTSFYYLVANMLGFTTGPTLYAYVAEHFYGGGPNATAMAMLTCYGSIGPLGLCVMGLLARNVSRWKAPVGA